MKVSLYAPKEYWEGDHKGRDCRGCGPGGIGDWLVPDTIWGLNVRDACHIHDYMYDVGETELDKRISDRVFLNNLVRIVEAKGGLFKTFRLIRCVIMYYSVAVFGGPAFWMGKNDNQFERSVQID